MKLLVIRHGESEADLLDVHEGRADFALTEREHRQAHLDFLVRLPVSFLIRHEIYYSWFTVE